MCGLGVVTIIAPRGIVVMYVALVRSLRHQVVLLLLWDVYKKEKNMVLKVLQHLGRFVAMGWHGVANATPGQQDITFCPPWNFSAPVIIGLSL